MAHVSAVGFAGKTKKVRLLIDQKIRGVALKKGDTADVTEADAKYLKALDRVEFVAVDAPKQAER